MLLDLWPLFAKGKPSSLITRRPRIHLRTERGLTRHEVTIRVASSFRTEHEATKVLRIVPESIQSAVDAPRSALRQITISHLFSLRSVGLKDLASRVEQRTRRVIPERYRAEEEALLLLV